MGIKLQFVNAVNIMAIQADHSSLTTLVTYRRNNSGIESFRDCMLQFHKLQKTIILLMGFPPCVLLSMNPIFSQKPYSQSVSLAYMVPPRNAGGACLKPPLFP